MKKNILQLTIVTIIILTPKTIFSQNSIFTDVGIQSPTAASLGKYGGDYMGGSSGAVQYSIPLYEIISGDIKIPISLSYQSSGLKLEEIPGWVGLGWTLNAGGVVTRTVQSIADDQAFGMIVTGSQLASNYTSYTSNGSFSIDYVEDFQEGFVDTKSDLYFYNTGALSGKFFMYTDGSLRKEQQGNEKISYSPSSPTQGFTQWNILSGSGLEYIFDEKEQIYSTETGSSTGGDSQYISSWYLGKIKSPTSTREVDFDYLTGGLTTIQRKSHQEKFDGTSLSQGITCNNENAISTTEDEYTPKYLDEIITENQEIRFISSFRTDYTTLKKLDEIQIYTNGVLEKKFVFGYTYLSSKKLLLNSVTEYDGNGQEFPSHIFEYNSGSIPSSGHLSKETDHWGYYNGKSDNSTQTTNHLPAHIDYDSAYRYTGLNKKPDASYSKRGMLSKITFPTGGYTSFEYEANEVGFNGAPYLSGAVISDDLNRTEMCFASWYQGSNDICTNTFTIDGAENATDLIIETEVVATIPQGGTEGEDDLNAVTGNSGFYLTRTSDNTVIWSSYGQDLASSPLQISIQVDTGEEYELKSLVESSDTEVDNLTVNVFWEVKLPYNYLDTPLGKYKVGGVRLKTTTTNDGMSNDVITNYTYNHSNYAGKSSGVLINLPSSYHEFTVGGVCNFRLRSTSNLIALGASSSHVIYSEITKVEIDGSNEYKTVSKFSTLQNSGSALKDELAVYYPLSPTTSFSHKRGILKSSTAKNLAGDEVSVELNTNVHANYESIPALHFDRFVGTIVVPSTSGNSSSQELFLAGAYEYKSQFQYFSQQSQKIYEDNDFVETKVDYSYSDIPNHYSPTSVTKTNSLTSEKRKTTYTYAHEVYNSAGEMEDLNMLVQPYSVLVEDESGVDVSKSWTIWDDGITGALTGAWLPEEQWTWKSTGTAPSTPSTSNAIKVSEIQQYDTYGNPLKLADANGMVTKAYYGSNASPFQNATTTGNAVNGVLGMYLTGVQKVQGTDDCASNCGTRPGSGDDLFTEAEYDDLGRVTKVMDENEQETSYGYDSFNRLLTTTNANGFVVGANGYGYSATRNGGSYSSTDPNNVEQITYIDPLYTTDFSNSSGWTSVDSFNTFNVEAYGENTVRMGGDGNYKTMLKTIGEEDLIARIDFYPDNTTGGTPHIYFDSGGDRFTVQYRTSLDAFRVQYRINYGSFTYPFSFPLDGSPDQWYTIELQKKGGELTAWVYPKGQGRDPDNSYTTSGFSATWTPDFRLTTSENYFYAANLSIAKSSQSSISYLDGLGREIQTQLRGGDKVIATETLYNERGLPEVVSRPIEEDASSFPGFYDDGLMSGGSTFTPGSAMPTLAPVASHYSTYHSGSGDNDELYAYSYTQYEDSPLARVEKSTLPGEDHQTVAAQAVTTTYGLNTTESFTINGKTWSINTLNKTISKDPNGNETITYIDGWGQTIVSGVNMNPTSDDILDKSSSDLVTYFEYDARGNLVRVEDPMGLPTTYTYNTLGQLESKKLPDQAHSHQYRYDKKGRLRFHIDPNMDAASNHYYYTKYDDLDRPIEVGKRDSDQGFNDETDINTQSFPTTNKTAYITYSYDGNNPYTGHVPNYTNGRLTKVVYTDPNSSYSGATYYSYNTLGLVEWVIQQPAQPTSSNNRKIEYTYDELGQMTRLYFNPLSGSSDDHYFWYYYDEFGRLEKVSSYGSNSEGSALTEAEYTYYADGQVEQLKLGDGAQTVDYDYTIQGWLEYINDPDNIGNDAFGGHYTFHNGGNIKRQKWQQPQQSSAIRKYFYHYDESSQLREACYSNTTCNGGAFDVAYTYDKNGGMESITRYDNSGNWTLYDHVYESGTNKLDYVEVDGVSSATQTKQFSHDASGNVTENRVQGITATTYDWRNLPTSLSANGSTLTYLYDADGNRVKKQMGSTATWYVRGADGQTIAAYDNSGNLLFLNILAGGQIIGQIEN